MLREYTAAFTSVKPCLYQPPPGTAIEVAPRPAGVKLHVPLRSTEVIAALPAAPAAATVLVATGAARAELWIARVGPPRATATASPPAAVDNRPRRRTFERCMATSCSSPQLQPGGRIVSTTGRRHRTPESERSGHSHE